jgi:hypothetical protein
MCEETHLQGVKEVPSHIASSAHKVYVFARRAVRLAGDDESRAAVEDAINRRQVKITEVMDSLWTIQEIIFNLMLPWRTELPEDVDFLPLEEWGDSYVPVGLIPAEPVS